MGTDPPLSQIASDLRVEIRITNGNRNQIARFGALSFSIILVSSASLFVIAPANLAGRAPPVVSWTGRPGPPPPTP